MLTTFSFDQFLISTHSELENRKEFFNLISPQKLDKEVAEEHPAEVRLPSSTGASPPRRPTKHPQACSCAVQQGASARPQSQAPFRDQRGPQKDPGDQGRRGLAPRRVHKHHKQLLPGGDCQVLLAWLQ